MDSGQISAIPNQKKWLNRPGLEIFSGTCDALTHDTCWIDEDGGVPYDMPEIVLSGYTPGDTIFFRMWGYNDNRGYFQICALEDTEDPTIACPADENRGTDPDQCSVALTIDAPIVSDNYGVASVINDFSGTEDASGTYPLDTTIVEWTVRDYFGNTATCKQRILVSDTQAPGISCLQDQIVAVDANCEYAIPDFRDSVTVTDLCDPAPVITQLPAAGTRISGTATVQLITFSARDQASNTSQCQFNVTLQDTISPSLSCPGNIIEYIGTSCEFTLPDYTTLTMFSDNCDSSPSIEQTPAAGTVLSGQDSIHVISFSVEDNSGNEVECRFNLVLRDTVSPSFTCIEDHTVFAQSNCTYTIPDYSGLVAYTDNCDPAPVFIQDPLPGTLMEGSGTVQTVSLIAEDQSGNIANCSFKIGLADTTPPELNCPGDLEVYLDANCQYHVADLVAGMSIVDQCDPSPMVQQLPMAGTMISGSEGVAEVWISAADQYGNRDSCKINLLILDQMAPELVALSDTTILLAEGYLKTDVILPDPVFTDNCGIASVVNDINGGLNASGEYTYGVTTVVYTVGDVNGNETEFVQRVELQLEDPPELGLVIPEAFSPNEDGFNDRFEILGLEQYPENELVVYNVQGLEVFRMKEYDNSWNGTSTKLLGQGDGNLLLVGTYYYVLYPDANIMVKGTVYLRRE